MGGQDDQLHDASTLAATPGRASASGNDATLPADATELIASSAIAPGEVMGRYRVLELLGIGGMGVVVAAYDPDLDRRVALKLLRGRHDEAHATRLRAEARALARLSHPNVVAVHEIGRWRDRDFVAMEYVDGATAAEWRAAAPRSWREVLEVYRAAGAGLAAAHRAKLVHRDVKPSNILVGHDGRVRVSDFGLARPEGVAGASLAGTAIDATNTRTGAVLGTPAYMSPEQGRGQSVDARSDQFSFCVALFESLYGTRPFVATTLDDLVESIERAAPVTGDLDAEVPPWLRKVVLRGLVADPASRYPSMDALLDALSPPRSRWRERGWIAAAICAVAIAVIVVAVRDEPSRGAVCPDPRTRLAGVWDGELRETSRLAMSGVTGGAEAHARVASALDAYADAWVLARQDACEATHVRREQSEARLDLRTGCLDRRRAALGALARRLIGTVDRDLANRAIEAALRLPTLDACADPDMLDRVVGLPADPDARARAEAVLDRLAEVRVLQDTGAIRPALALATTVVADAVDVDYPPGHAEALAALGQVQDDLGDGVAAQRSFHEALRVASTAHAEDQVAAAGIGLLWTTAYTLEQADAAQAMAPLVEAAVTLSPSPKLRADLENSLGSVAWLRGELAAARGHFERGLALAEELFGPDDIHIAAHLSNLGAILDELDDLAGAEAHYTRALAIDAAALGPTHPRLASIYCNLGDLRWARGQHLASRDSYGRCRDLRRDGLGPEHAETLLAEQSLGDAAFELGELGEAERIYRDVLARRERALGADHGHVATTLSTLARTLTRLGRPAEGRALVDRSVELQRVVWGADSQHVADAMVARAELAIAEGRLEDAARDLDGAVAIDEHALGADHRATLVIRAVRCDLSIRRRRDGEAVADCERAVSGLVAADVDPAWIGRAQWALARALAAGDELARAADLAHAAERSFVRAEGDHGAILATIRAWRPR